MSYTLRLVALRCVVQQESLGNDNIYVRINGETVLSSEKLGYQFSDEVTEDTTNQFDFQTARVTLKDGTHPAQGYAPSQFIFTHLTESTVIEVWESDEGEFLHGADDLIGELTITGDRTTKGTESVSLTSAGADYELFYVVTQE